LNRTLPLVAAAIISLTPAARAARLEILTSEPPAGSLRPGQTVFVDDGRCPVGQISQVTGGSNIGGQRGDGAPRTRSCVARP
jgi:hypothetical protein